MINKLIYVKPGVYKAQPEWNYNTSKNSNKKLAIYHSVIAQVISDWDKNTYEVKMIFGEGNSFCRSENHGRTRINLIFYINKSEAYHDGVVNRIHRKLKANIEEGTRDPNLRTEFLLVDEFGLYFTQKPKRISVDKMMKNQGQQVVYEFDGVFIEQKDLKPITSSRTETLVIAKALAKEFGASVTNGEEFEQEDISEIEIDMAHFNFYRSVKGSFYVNKNKLTDLKKDLQELYNKYAETKLETRLLEIEIDDSRVLSLGEEEIHTTARNMGLNIEQILLDKKGFIVGRKFGI